MAATPTAARPRTPALILGSIVLALAVLVAAVALTARQTAPPAIAEFAPQAVEQIKQTLDDQAPDVTPDGEAAVRATATPTPTTGASAGATPASGASATPSPTPTVVVPRVRQCVGSPPRQT